MHRSSLYGTLKKKKKKASSVDVEERKEGMHLTNVSGKKKKACVGDVEGKGRRRQVFSRMY